MMKFLMLLVSNILNFIIFWYFCNWSIKKEQINCKLFSAIIILIVIKMWCLKFQQPLLNLIIDIITYIIILWFHKTTIKKKIAISIPFISAFISVSFLSEKLGILIIEIIDKNPKITMLTIFFTILMSKFILLSFSYIVSRLFNTIIIKDINNKSFLLMFLFPISTILIIASIRYPILIEGYNISYIFSFIFILIANICSCFGFYKVVFIERTIKENDVLKERQKRDEYYYNLLLNKYENNHILTHDIKKNLMYLQNLSRNKDYKGIDDFLNEYKSSISNESIFLTGNKTFDIILSSMKNEIDDLRIHINLKNVKKINLDDIAELDLCAILGNILENAIMSCSKCEPENRYISFSFESIDNRRILKVVNSCVSAIELNEEFITMRENREYHGFGLKSVKKSVLKYNGILSTVYDANEREFITTAMFQ